MAKFFSYLKYFLFIAWNWNIKLAWFMITQEIKGEKKYHLHTTGFTNLDKLIIESPSVEDAQPYQGASYFLLENIFQFLKEQNANHNIIDFGSGKGRVMAVSAHYGFTDITGIEFSAELCMMAKKNLKETEKLFPQAKFNIIHADASFYEIEKEAYVFFFFNPFNESVMKDVIRNINVSLKQYPRKVYIAYVNPVHKDLFEAAGYKQIFHLKKMEYVEASVLSI